MISYNKHDASLYEESRKLSESTTQTTLPETLPTESQSEEKEKLTFNSMDYIDIRKDQRFKAATLKENVDNSSEALMVTLRMLYENQKKILSNQETIWLAITHPGPDTILKHDLAKSFDKIAYGFITAANKIY